MGEWRYSSTIFDLGTRWSGQLHAPAALPPGEKAPATRWIGSWVDPRVGLDAVEKRKFLHCRESNPGRPAIPTELSRHPVLTASLNNQLKETGGSRQLRN
jgi:hypothetical protein